MNLQSTAQHLTSQRELYRCFFALAFPEEVIATLVDLMTELRRHGADVRWVSPRNLHMTLRFLGEIEPGSMQAARGMLRSLSGASPFRVRASGLGAFPALRAPRVFWTGVQGGTPQDTAALMALQATTEEWARAIGIAPEKGRYRAHITLGRVAQASPGLRPLVDDVTTRAFTSPFCTVDELLLIRSTLLPGGAVYEVIDRAALAG